jgi:hypothetical protein
VACMEVHFPLLEGVTFEDVLMEEYTVQEKIWKDQFKVGLRRL